MTELSLDLTFLRDLVRRESGIVLESGKDYLVSSRVTPVAHDLGYRGLSDLVRDLRHHPAARTTSRVVEALTTNETLWFRDLEPFAALRRVILPELVRARPARRVRLWSAACSSGQEPYSALMTAFETPDMMGIAVQMLATDLSAAMVERTREGRYSRVEVARGLGRERLMRWFVADGEHWRAGPELTAALSAKVVNLTRPLPVAEQQDVILLRNVLIYFDVETKREVLRRMRRVLAPDGYLMLGATESTVGLDDAWRPVAGLPGVYRPT